MEKQYCVYMHMTPSGKRYFGITSTKPSIRWGKDGKGYADNKYFSRAIQKYGWDNIKHVIVCDGLTQKEACQKEIDLISEYKTNKPEHGYNLTCGGEGATGHKNKRAKGVRNKTTGVEFRSMQDAALHYGVSVQSIKNSIMQKETRGRYKWAYTDDELMIEILAKKLGISLDNLPTKA